MKLKIWAGAAAAWMAVFPAFSADEEASPVEVRFVVPERYTDIGMFGSEASRNRETLEAMFHGFAPGCLSEGLRLHINVLDVRLAGEAQPWRYGGEGPRVMLERRWPRVKLGYVLHDADGKVVDEAEETVRDVNYLARSSRVSFDREPLPYERAMLKDWFEARFCPHSPEHGDL